jgi:hypothetical protein
MKNLLNLIEEAKRFGSVACSSGHHTWMVDGGRPCPKNYTDCSQTVYFCSSCGEIDYGYEGGPAHKECWVNCTRD